LSLVEKNLRVVMIGPFGMQPKGTMSARALPLARSLVEQGMAVKIIIPPWDDPQASGKIKDEGGVVIENVSLPASPSPFFHLILTKRMVSSALAFSPDVIHLFKPKGYSGFCHLYLWLRRKLTHTAYTLILDEDDWEQAWNERLHYNYWQRQFFNGQERWGLRHADKVVAASRELQILARRFNSQQNVSYIPNGVASLLKAEERRDGPSSRQHLGLGDGLIILLYTRFLEFDFTRVIEILKRIIDETPDARILIVGKGLGNEEEAFLALCQSNGLAGHIHYAGWVTPEELPIYFAAADVAIYPYRDDAVNRTKCSVKLVEMMSAGLPMVADAIGQNSEYIIHGESGLLVNEPAPAAFAGAVLSLLKDSGERCRLGENAAKRINEHYLWPILAGQLQQVYFHHGDKQA
jgi:glycosyltransferase involved in cell wall biosynthesis